MEWLLLHVSILANESHPVASHLLESVQAGCLFRRSLTMFPRAIGFLVLTVCLAAVLGVTGCERPFSDRAQDVSVFRFSENGAPVTMDPVQSATQYANLMTTSIYDQLYDYKYLARPYQLKPRLAEALPEISEDGLTYTIQIKKGVFYADDECFPGGRGREVVAGDSVYSMQRIFDPKTPAPGPVALAGKNQRARRMERCRSRLLEADRRTPSAG